MTDATQAGDQQPIPGVEPGRITFREDQPPRSVWIFNGGKDPVLTIEATGELILGPGLSIDGATQGLAEAMVNAWPAHFEAVAVAFLKKRGFCIIPPKGDR